MSQDDELVAVMAASSDDKTAALLLCLFLQVPPHAVAKARGRAWEPTRTLLQAGVPNSLRPTAATGGSQRWPFGPTPSRSHRGRACLRATLTPGPWPALRRRLLRLLYTVPGRRHRRRPGGLP